MPSITWRELAAAASAEPAGGYVLFALRVGEVRSNDYGDVPMPEPQRWP